MVSAFMVVLLKVGCLGWLASFPWARKGYCMERASARSGAGMGERMVESHRNGGFDGGVTRLRHDRRLVRTYTFLPTVRNCLASGICKEEHLLESAALAMLYRGIPNKVGFSKFILLYLPVLFCNLS